VNMGEAQRKTWKDLECMAKIDPIVDGVLRAYRGRMGTDDILLEIVGALVEERAHRIKREVQEKLTDPPRPVQLAEGQWAFPCEACRQWAIREEQRTREAAILREGEA